MSILLLNNLNILLNIIVVWNVFPIQEHGFVPKMRSLDRQLFLRNSMKEISMGKPTIANWNDPGIY